MSETDAATKEKIRVRINLAPPPAYNVIYVNDNVTTMEFVIDTLVTIFGHSEAKARALTVQVHEDGAAVVATLPYELAEQKGSEVMLLARNNGFPLVVKLETA